MPTIVNNLNGIYHRHDKWLLIVGCLLVAVGFLPMFIDLPDSTEREYDMLGFGMWGAVFATCVIAPVVEEVEFRLWTIGKRYAHILTIVLQGASFWYGFNWIWAIAVAAVLTLCVLIRNTHVRRYALAVATSLSFGLAHLATYYDTASWVIILDMARFVGSGLVLTYVALKFSLLWSMVAHAAINTSLLIPVLVIWGDYNKLSYSTAEYSLNVEPMHTFRHVPPPTLTEDSIVLYGSMPYIAYNLLQFHQYYDTTFDSHCGQTLYKTENILFFQYRVSVVRRTDRPLNFMDIVEKLADSTLLQIDTTYENMRVLTVEDEDLLMSKIDGSSDHNPNIMIWILRTYGLPVILDPSVNGKLPLSDPFDPSTNFRTWQEYAAFLRKEYGMEIEERTGERMQVICFK